MIEWGIQKMFHKWMPNWSQNGIRNPSKILQRGQGGAKGAPKRRKRLEKRHAENGANEKEKISLPWVECAWPILASSKLIRLTLLLATGSNTAAAPRPRRAVLSPQNGSHGALRRGRTCPQNKRRTGCIPIIFLFISYSYPIPMLFLFYSYSIPILSHSYLIPILFLSYAYSYPFPILFLFYS